MSLRQELIEYSESVLNGDIVACVKHKWACRRFLYDLEREGSEGFPYIFDEARAERFMDWMKLFKHRKGVLAGKNIDPHIIQKFNFGNIYGWVHVDTEYRRFKKAYWQVARKNAKSQSLGTVGSYESSAFGEPFAEVYCAATKKDQAKLVWDEIEGMIMANEDLKDKFKVAYGTITHLKSGSIIKALSKEDRKTGDGTSPSTFIIDEYHAHETAELYDIGDSGQGARAQPLLMVITTAGFELDYPCYRVEYHYVSQILDPDNPIENDEYFAMINELDEGDDIADESNWVKANPIICSYENGINYLRSQFKVAQDVPEKMRNFMTKNMNIWIDQKQGGYMPLAKWNACGREDVDVTGHDVYIGLDLSKRIDLTSSGFVFPVEWGFHVKQHSFIPEDMLRERQAKDKVPYQLWMDKGWLSVTPGAVVDYSFVEEWIEKTVEENGWNPILLCYDPWGATQFAQNMAAKGFTTVEIRQGTATLSEPTKEFRESIYQEKITHDGDELLAWTVGNAITEIDHNENIRLSKRKSRERIDPIAAVINAFVQARFAEMNTGEGNISFISINDL
ncbi:terminase [Viridibacillus sp. FSL H7-0596]|uniref:terminase large subunit n=1 Tax=Viridibacillus sp. FSL H7-0596 TaxID=1928923 RepID=UPI00096EB1D0|nr:terminase TerL endonuclease subunit [Viridibacillus sp. FSL H7-0596]OMC87451.1 terminase [Viridibacillus sp. FSL H7-0596]